MTDGDGSLAEANKAQARCKICGAVPSAPKDIQMQSTCRSDILGGLHVGERQRSVGFSRLLEALAEREEEGKQVGQESQEAEQAGSLPSSVQANNHLSLPYPQPYAPSGPNPSLPQCGTL